MRAVVLERKGAPRVLRWSDVAEPEPGPGQVRVRVQAIGINYAEILSRKGLYGWAPRRPYTLGMEAAGVIDAVSSDAGREVGEAVMVGTQHGAYAEALVVPQSQALPSLSGFGPVEAAAFPVNYMTAWVSLMRLGRLSPGETVVVSPAGGGVGTAAVQLAVARGARVVGLAGSEDKLARVRELGAEATVSYRRRDFPGALSEAVGPGGAQVILEMVGGAVFRAAARVAAPMGRIVVAGYASLDYRWWDPLSWWRAWRGIPRLGLRDQFTRSLGFYATHLGYLLDDPPRMRAIWDELGEFVHAHGIRPVVGRVFSMEELADAHRFMESRKSYGKLVVRLQARLE